MMAPRVFPPMLVTVARQLTGRCANVSVYAFGNIKPFVPALTTRHLLISKDTQDSQIPCYRTTTGVVSLQCLKSMLKTGDVQLFDVREPKELKDEGKIPGSINLPVDEMSKALALPPEKFMKKYGVVKPLPSDENIVFYCRSGKRAERALKVARRFGYTQVNNYNGGWLEWKRYKIE